MSNDTVETAAKDTPDVATADTIPPVAKITDIELPSSFHFFNRFNSFLYAQLFCDTIYSRLLILLIVVRSICLRYDSIQIC